MRVGCLGINTVTDLLVIYMYTQLIDMRLPTKIHHEEINFYMKLRLLIERNMSDNGLYINWVD